MGGVTQTMLIGDSGTVLMTLPDRTFDCCVTSPPYYQLRDYQLDGQIGLEKTPALYVDTLVDIFRKVRRVLADDATLWVVIGDSYWGDSPPRRASSDSFSKTWNPADSAGQGGLRRTAARLGDLKRKDLIGIPWMLAFALRADGWWLRQDIIWAKPNPMPASVTDRCTTSHEHIFMLSKSAKYRYDAEAIKEPSVTNDPRRPYTSQGAKALDGRVEWKSGQKRDGGDFTKRNKRDVWTVTTKPYKGAHFATFPPDLIEPCVLAGSRPEGTVLDPFAGTGTVGLVCSRHNRSFVGIDLDPRSEGFMRDRIELNR